MIRIIMNCIKLREREKKKERKKAECDTVNENELNMWKSFFFFHSLPPSIPKYVIVVECWKPIYIQVYGAIDTAIKS